MPNPIDFGSNPIWGSDWSRAKEYGNSELVAKYEEIMQQQLENDPAVLQAAIINVMISSGHSLKINEATKTDMLAAIQSATNYVAKIETPDRLAEQLGWNADKIELSPSEVFGRLLNDLHARSDGKLSLADMWRAGLHLNLTA
jgi:hypothetical protein